MITTLAGGKITTPPVGTWCEYCKGRWGKYVPKEGGSPIWHKKAQTLAVATIHSTHFSGRSRSLCRSCITDVELINPDGSIFTIPQQLAYANEVLSVQSSRV